MELEVAAQRLRRTRVIEGRHQTGYRTGYDGMEWNGVEQDEIQRD